MRSRHAFDKEFRYASPFLKKALIQFEFLKGRCLDIPCGNGRNVFLLAKHFQNVTAIDKEQEYLNSINAAVELYDAKPVKTVQMDIKDCKIDFSAFDFICCIHYFKWDFLKAVIDNMRPNGTLLLETPSCSGGNYHDLPNEKDIENLTGMNKQLFLQFHACGHSENSELHGSVKLLLKKL